MGSTLPKRELTLPDRPKIRRLRTGCIQCKSRRLKCPEDKPACMRCIRSNLECKYATKPSTTAKQPLRPILPVLSDRSVSRSTLCNVRPTIIKLSAEEGLYVDHYFRFNLAKYLGSLPPADFWIQCIQREFMRDEGIRKCVIALGALTRVAPECSTQKPLFKSQALASDHQAKAMKYYGTALADFRRRLSTPDSEPRTILIFTMLFLAFETFQGNTVAVDQLMGYAAVILKDVILCGGSRNTRSLIAAPMDDDGTLAGELMFARLAVLNSEFSPMYPMTMKNARLWRYSLREEDIPTSKDDYASFWIKLWKAVNTAAIAFNRIAQRAVDGEAKHTGSPLQIEQSELLRYWKLCSHAFKEKWKEEVDPAASVHLGITASALDVTEAAIRCSLDPTGRMWDAERDVCIVGLRKLRMLLDIYPLDPVHRTVFLEGTLLGVLVSARGCRDAEVRSISLSLCKSLVNARSSWDVKAVYLGTYALLTFEETFRDSNGEIPLHARYEWTGGRWNESHTELEVVLSSRLYRHPTPITNTIIIRPSDLGLV